MPVRIKPEDGISEILAASLGPVLWPVMWVGSNGIDEKSLGGSQVCAVSGAEVASVSTGGRVVGRIMEDEDAVYCCLGSIQPENGARSRAEQVREVLERIESALRDVQMDFSHVVRTWFYLDRILDWYGDFNRVRSEFFKERGVFDGVVPASTGVGVSGLAGSALVASALAMRSKRDAIRVVPVASPLQCPALAYGSAFSRALEVAHPRRRCLYVSGTASVKPNGETAHPGDRIAQTDLTLRAVNAILESRGMDWSHIVRAVVYITDLDGVRVFEEVCRRLHVGALPVVFVQGEICRSDLLFEIEADAVIGA